MSGWGIQTVGGVLGGAGNGDEPVTVLVAGSRETASGLHSALLGDVRFRVLAVATTPMDVKAKLAMEPDALLLDGTVFEGPEELTQTIGGYRGDAFVLLPAGVPPSAADAVRAIPAVRDVLVGEVNFVELAGRIYETARARKQAAASGAGRAVFAGARPAGTTAAAGWRAIAVWSPQGGVGKSTIATSLALESASRRLPTILIGLGAPDPIPLSMGLRSEPNITTWLEDPTPEKLRLCIQKFDTLDVLGGFPDPVALAGYIPRAQEGAASLPSLANAAAYAGYAVVIFDVSSQELAAPALVASNALVLVARPTLNGLLQTVEAVRLVNDTMAGQHSIAREAVHLVINRYRDSTFQPTEFVKSGGDVRGDFPSLAASVPDDPEIEAAHNRQRPGYLHSEHLRKAMAALGNVLLSAPVEARSVATVGERKVKRFGPLRIRM